jgi:hypothetical protein
MRNEFEGDGSRRRYKRVTGPFDGRQLALADTPVLIYDLNLGGCFVNSMHEQLEGSALLLKIDLLQEGWITVNAETLYRHQFGFAVRFVDIGEESAARLVRTVDALRGR